MIVSCHTQRLREAAIREQQAREQAARELMAQNQRLQEMLEVGLTHTSRSALFGCLRAIGCRRLAWLRHGLPARLTACAIGCLRVIGLQSFAIYPTRSLAVCLIASSSCWCVMQRERLMQLQREQATREHQAREAELRAQLEKVCLQNLAFLPFAVCLCIGSSAWLPG